MSTAVDNRAPRLSYGPNRLIGAGAAVVAAVAVALALTTGDRAGRTLYLLAALALAAVAALDLIWNPRLTADQKGLVVRSPTGGAALAWHDVDAIRVDERSRYGLASRTLEVDAGHRLILVSQRALGGADPRDVAALLEAFRR